MEGLSWYIIRYFPAAFAANAPCFIKIRLAAVKDMKYVFVSFSALDISSAAAAPGEGIGARERENKGQKTLRVCESFELNFCQLVGSQNIKFARASFFALQQHISQECSLSR